jgi:glutathione S-transferase
MTRLYHHPLSPFSRKVRLVLAEKRIEVELVEERYWERDPDFLRRNPLGQVPVLRLGAHVMADSGAICEYLEEAVPQPPLLPQGAEARYEVRRIAAWFDGRFHAEVTARLMNERVLKKLRGGGVPDSAAVKAASRDIKEHLARMTELLDTRRWLAGPDLTLADFAAAAQLSCLDYVSDVPWDQWEAVREWYSKIKSRPAFRSLLADQVPGFRPASHYADLDF